MTTTSQPFSTAFTAPSVPAIAAIPDATNGKTKLALYLAAPIAGEPSITSCDFMRRLAGVGSYAAIGNPAAPTSKGLAISRATLTGFNAFRQIPDIPDVGAVHGWNLAKNGGFNAGLTAWTPAGTGSGAASVVADAASPSGEALRLVNTSGDFGYTADIPTEPGKTLSIACQVRGDTVCIGWTQIAWLDGTGAQIGITFFTPLVSPAAYAEESAANNVAPGSARTARVGVFSRNAGIVFITAIRVKQQAAAPLAWTAADQQVLGNQGLSIQEATTNLTPADADMETAGVASWTASTATLAKDTTKKFAGTQSLKVTNTAANGYAAQAAALAAGQAISLSARVIGGDAGAGVALYSTPSNALVASSLGASTDWVVRTVSGVIAGGDTGWQLRLIGGSGVTAVSNFDNCGVENKAYQTLNSGDGQEFTTTTRPASSVTETLPTGFDWTQGFAFVGTYRPDHSQATITRSRTFFSIKGDANNYMQLMFASSDLQFFKDRATIASNSQSGAIGLSAGDTLAWGALFIPGSGFWTVYSLNGGAPVTTPNVTAEAQLAPAIAAAQLYVGDAWYAGESIDGTVGIDRIWTTVDATTLAKVQTAVTGNAPYGNPTDTDTAVWAFNGQAYQVPTYDDVLAASSMSYNYEAIVYASSNGTSTTSQPATTSVAFTDWWLMNDPDRTKSTKIDVIEAPELSAPLPTQEYIALGRPYKIIEYGPNLLGDEGKVQFFAEDTAYAALLAIKAIAGLNQQYIALKAPNGMFWNVKPKSVAYKIKENGMIEGSLEIVQVAAT